MPIISIIASGAILSLAVWGGGFFIRKRLRGPARMIMMTVLVILWYMVLLPSIGMPQDMDELTISYRIGIHTIWVWWIWALIKFLLRIKKEAARTNIKTGIYKSTGLHRITKELRRLREQRKAGTAKAVEEKPGEDKADNKTAAS